MAWRFFGLRGRHALQGLDDEIRDHLEQEIEVNIARGMPADEARRQARVKFGNVTLAIEDTHAVWAWSWLGQARQDLQYAWRALRKSPGFAATALLTLSLGIGANTGVFTLVDALLLRQLPVPHPEQLLQVSMTPRGARDSALSDSLSYPVVRLLAEQRDLFAGVGGFNTFSFDAGPPEDVRRTPGAFVTGAFYETLGVVPVAGRLLTRDDDRVGAPLVAVITDGYWKRRLARDPRIIGQPYRVNGRSVTIVGVSPPGFSGAHVGWAADLTLPASAVPQVRPELSALLGPGNIWLRVLVRLQPGISQSQVEARLPAIWPQLSSGAVAPHFTEERRAAIANARFLFRSGATGWTNLRDLFARPLYVLMGLVGLVMLIACANMAGLLLARATTRQKEMAIRRALGAGRGRIVRQLLTESLLLSLLGGVLGIYLAWLSSGHLVDLLSAGPLQVTFDLTPNGRVLTFTTALSAATAALFGLAPAWHATARAPLDVLTAMGRSPPRNRLLPFVVTAQVALCVMLLVGAGLFLRTFQNLRGVNTGFQHEGVLLVDVEGRGSPTFYQQALDGIARLPGVLSVSVSTNTPLSGVGWSERVTIDGQQLERELNFVAVSPRYFETLRTPLLRGRAFATTDAADRARVAIVNQAFARRYLGDRDPIGRHFLAAVSQPPSDLEIVGLVRDVIANDLRGVPPATVYVPFFQVQVAAQNFSTVQVRTDGALPPPSDAIRRVLQPLMAGSPVNIRTLTEQVDAASVRERLVTTLATGLGMLALVLAVVGVYGLLAYSVAARAKEIGVRVALGADRRHVLRLVLRQGVRLAASGTVIGVAGAAVLTRFLDGLLFGLTPLDPTTFIAVSLLVVAVALTASCIPARRATKVDPLAALKAE